jgi:glutamate/tyrosine decarboxylase-like PLP-dependent enzyme/glutathione synthase/RimK-type ligase-like ATP-grasp enzyme
MQRAQTLDPEDWTDFRHQAHKMLDDMLAYLENIRERPVWQLPPPRVREEIPRGPAALKDVHDQFLTDILPYSSGNLHPGFMGWVQGGGTPVGMLADMLAAGMNANLGGRHHMPAEIERQVVSWMRQLFGFPESATGLFVTGTSMANLTAVVVARKSQAGQLTAYASTAVHGCIAKALDVTGIGRDSLRLIPTDDHHRIDISELEQAIEADRAVGLTPFLVVGTAGTVDIGAIDDLAALADVCHRHNVWFHVDGAYAALAILAPDLAPRLNGIERADSLAFDFHKWGQTTYSAGFLLVRHGLLHRAAFQHAAAYLTRATGGLAAGEDWPCDFGIDLSRSFQALKVWFTWKVFGTEALGAVISGTCRLAQYLKEQIQASSELELMASVQLNIVCFRFRAMGADRVNAHIVMALQEAGEVAPSTTTLNGHLVIRAAIVNHRTTCREMDLLVQRIIEIGNSLLQSRNQPAVLDHPWQRNEEALAKLDQQPETPDLLVERAALLGDLGRIQEARDQYLKVLARDPAHSVALNQLGTLLYGTGYRTAAHTAYAEAVAQHPTDVISLINLANVLLDEGNMLAAKTNYEAALQQSAVPEAHQGMARALAELGDEQQAAIHRHLGYTNHSLAALPYRGRNRPIDLLLLVSAKGGNIPLRHLLDDTQFRTFVLTADYFSPSEALPPHQVVFNSIGDADLARDALLAADSLLLQTDVPVLNNPAAVLPTGRAAIVSRLRNLPGVVTPLTVILPRESISARTLALHNFEFPLLLRAPGFHTGRHFVKVESPANLESSLAVIPGKQVTVIQYLDAHASDGKSRKYRVMMIDGQLYPLHLAISSHWKIHYFTAEMSESAAHRAEDEAFLRNMPAVLGPKALSALRQIQSTLSLDYAGIDFGLSPSGELLLFEANATMVVMRPEPQPHWNYRRPAVEQIHIAVRKMLTRSATSPTPPQTSTEPQSKHPIQSHTSACGSPVFPT